MLWDTLEIETKTFLAHAKKKGNRVEKSKDFSTVDINEHFSD